ncbi:17121_t:CDS:2, partial [Racocetra fulgida]
KQESEKLTKQERNKLHYQQKREELKAKRRQRYQTQKSEQKDTSTNNKPKNSKVNVEAKRDEKEGVNDNALENEGLSVNIRDFEAAEKLIDWLEKVKEKEDKFPRKWLKKCLAEKNEAYNEKRKEYFRQKKREQRTKSKGSVVDCPVVDSNEVVDYVNSENEVSHVNKVVDQKNAVSTTEEVVDKENVETDLLVETKKEPKIIVETPTKDVETLKVSRVETFVKLPNVETQKKEIQPASSQKRCFATYNTLAGMPLNILQRILGHSKISTTALYIKDSDLSNLNSEEQKRQGKLVQLLLDENLARELNYALAENHLLARSLGITSSHYGEINPGSSQGLIHSLITK